MLSNNFGYVEVKYFYAGNSLLSQEFSYLIRRICYVPGCPGYRATPIQHDETHRSDKTTHFLRRVGYLHIGRGDGLEMFLQKLLFSGCLH